MYARTVGDQTLSFGVSGMLWRDNLVMYDRQTGSWWAQASGDAIRGPLRGRALVARPSTMMTWREWRAAHPTTLVLAPPAGTRSSGRDVYAEYHRSRRTGVTGRTRSGGALDAKARVLGFRLGTATFAVAIEETSPLVQMADVAGAPFVIVLSTDREGGRIFLAGDHQFTPSGIQAGRPRMQDRATQSVWDGLAGVAISGAKEGTQLTAIEAHVSYWFSWHSFFPETQIVRAR